MSTTSLMTFAEFECQPEAPGKQELIDGELIQLPPPKYSHTEIAKRIYHLIVNTSHRDLAYQEGGYRIGDGWLQPDVSIRWPDQKIVDGYLSGGPMLAIEILSPGNTAEYIDRKLTLYLSAGCAEVWVVNPKRRTISVYRAEGDKVIRIVVEGTYSSPQLGLALELSGVFE